MYQFCPILKESKFEETIKVICVLDKILTTFGSRGKN